MTVALLYYWYRKGETRDHTELEAQLRQSQEGTRYVQGTAQSKEAGPQSTESKTALRFITTVPTGAEPCYTKGVERGTDPPTPPPTKNIVSTADNPTGHKL